MEYAKVILVWSTPTCEIEIGSTIDPEVLQATKHSILRRAQHKVAANIGDEVQEMKARYELAGLQALLNGVVPEDLNEAVHDE